MQLFYNSNLKLDSSEIIFSKEESRHIGKVLRKQEGDVITITNGSGYFFEVELTSVSDKRCIGSCIKASKQEPLPYELHLAVAPTKLNDRYEWFLEKATEIGVTQITPIVCMHSERKVIKRERYEKILQSAMKQSLSAYLPRLNPLISFQKFIENELTSEGQLLIAHCEPSKKTSIKELVKPNKAITILIGPEGDFSSEEIILAIKSGFIAVSLGNKRLRTETASIVACHSIAFINE